MKTVWKFPLPVLDVAPIAMPEGAEVLCVQNWNEAPCLWALVDDAKADTTEGRYFRIAGTGHELEDGWEHHYIGTIQTHSGTLVWHVFEVKS